MDKYFSIILPKWPALIVSGKDVTIDQAKEINIRTSKLFNLSTNEHWYARKIYEYLFNKKFNLNNTGYHGYDLYGGINNINEYFIKENKLKNELGYLNNHNILSSYIGGPHGWCSWSGKIATQDYNIGKYPEVEEVYNEWVVIAAIFPFLKFNAQLLNVEHCEDNPKPLIEFIIDSGKVKMKIPKSILLISTNSLSYEQKVEQCVNLLFTNNHFREIGCTFDYFVNAVEYVKQKVKNNVK